jgi:CO dehydrogenase maturation factor
VSKERLIEYEIQDCLRECGKFDLLTMGRPEGPGCYCYVNSLLRGHLAKLGAGYPVVVMDNEAGMEHLSRLTTNNVDVLLIVTEPTVVGVRSAMNLKRLADSLPVKIGKMAIVVNRVGADVNAEVRVRLSETGLEIAGEIPEDAEIAEFAATGRPLLELSAGSAAYKSAKKIIADCINAKQGKQ